MLYRSMVGIALSSILSNTAWKVATINRILFSLGSKALPPCTRHRVLRVRAVGARDTPFALRILKIYFVPRTFISRIWWLTMMGTLMCLHVLDYCGNIELDDVVLKSASR